MGGTEERLVRAYIGALDLVGVHVIAGGDELMMIRIGRDPAALAKRVQASTGHAVEVCATRWVRREEHACWIVEACTERLPKLVGKWLAITVPVATKAIEIVAAELGATLATDEMIRERAALVVRDVEEQVERMKAAGDLRPVTRAYRAHRLARAAEGKRAEPWHSYFASWKAGMVRAAAAAAAMR
jgi:hypothetical protein